MQSTPSAWAIGKAYNCYDSIIFNRPTQDPSSLQWRMMECCILYLIRRYKQDGPIRNPIKLFAPRFTTDLNVINC
jgi:hypothetical protein